MSQEARICEMFKDGMNGLYRKMENGIIERMEKTWNDRHNSGCWKKKKSNYMMH